MTDHNSMKADEYAQRQGEIDDLDNEIIAMMDFVEDELPSWVDISQGGDLDDIIYAEAKRRVMQAIKERDEP
jgi:hypothetical protein